MWWFKYLYHQMIAQNGCIVISIDNRGTPGPKGRAWRKSIYAKIGVISSEDQAAVAQKIFEKFDFIDSERVGIWGWSGGGSMTLNMLFRYPEIYKMGVAVAPVGHISLYDNVIRKDTAVSSPKRKKSTKTALRLTSPRTYKENSFLFMEQETIM